jgi:polyphosphate:AMP phosphotransferase
MFKEMESDNKISRNDYDYRLPELRHELLEAQFSLQEAGIPLLIIIAGVEGAGKGEVVNRINSWMDTRGIETHVFRKETEAMRKRPFYWRFWNVMPSDGSVGIYFGSWHSSPVQRFTDGIIKENNFNEELKQISFLEEMLTSDGMLIAKFWLHISKEEQYSRLRELESNVKTSWRVTKEDWEQHDKYDRFLESADHAIRATDTTHSPWHIIDASQKRFRDMTVMENLLNLMKNPIEKIKKGSVDADSLEPLEIAGVKAVLNEADLTKRLSSEQYSEEYDKLSHELDYLAWQCYQKEISSVFVFEGWDAGGKGGVIRRLISSLDAKLYRVIQIGAPTEEEHAHHYLWRFWRHIPSDGKITIYDRSWYGRVLVERVEGFAKVNEWQRAYSEINNFEEQLARHGTIVKKFWLQISSEEQMKRFSEREEVDYKRYKLTDEDWRNREKRDSYEEAVNDMIHKTDKQHAPWYIIPAEDKNYARMEVMKIVRDGMKKALGGDE